MTERTHENDALNTRNELVRRFFGSEHLDWNTADGRRLQEHMWRYLWKKAACDRSTGLCSADREDLAMQAFHKLLEGFRRGNELKRQSFKGLLALCRSAWYSVRTDQIRKRIRRKTHSFCELAAPGDEDGVDPAERFSDREPHLAGEGQPLDDCLEAERREHLQDLLGSLDARQRRLLELQLAGRTNEAIAEELGMSRANLYQVKKRATDRLRRLAGAHGLAEELSA